MAHVGVVLCAPWVGAFIWALVASCVRTEAKRRGLQLSYEAAVAVPDQAALLNELLDQGVDVLVFWPMSTSDPALLAVLDRAKAAKVPVITLDSFIKHAAVVCTVGSDNDAGQALITEVAFKAMGHRGRVVHFQGDQRLPVGVARNVAFHRVLHKYPGLELVHEAMLDWSAPRSRIEFGAECMRAVFAAGLKPDAVIAASDEGAEGAIQVIAEQGLAGKIIVTGFDGLSEALLSIRDGTMLGTIKQIPELIAEKAFDAALAALHSADLPRISRVDTELITRDNVMETALDALRLVPQFIFDLSYGQHVQRELQQAVITKQSKILSTVSAVSNLFGSMREPQKMMQDLVDLLSQDFTLHCATASPAIDNPLFVRCTRLRPAADTSEGEHPVLSLPLVSAGKPLGELELRGANAKSFDRQTVEILEAIANQVATALENANLYAHTVRLAQNELRETEAKLALAQRAEHLSYHDALTNLPNRRLLNKLLDQAIVQSHRYKHTLAVLFLDLDRFKLVNDTMGHEAGDKLLQEAARRLKGCLRDSDTVARLGGDEFVVMLPELGSPEEPATVAQKILLAIGTPFNVLGQEFSVTGSVGIAVYPDDGEDESTLMKNADIAMYHAKKEGKNNYQFYSARLNTNSLERLALEANLRHALERNEFCLHYQAKRDTATEHVSGMEVLLRWQHPDLGLVAPLQFLTVAEETGLILPIGKWVMKTACAQNVAWQKQGLPHLVISVNLTPRQFNDEMLVNDLLAILAETGMAPQLLELEIPEKTLLHNNVRTLAILTQLKQEGIRIAVDDFGMGYSSLSTLAQFPLDTIKIDRSLIHGVTGTLDDENLAEAIIAMGRTLSLTIVAQGVETREQADYLRKHTCNQFQGFYFNQPVPSEQLAEILRAQGGRADATPPAR
jgi:diguanylate cyclase (GGDEF)-like protein